MIGTVIGNQIVGNYYSSNNDRLFYLKKAGLTFYPFISHQLYGAYGVNTF